MSINVSAQWVGGFNPKQRFDILNATKTWADHWGPEILDQLKDATPKVTGTMAAKERYSRVISGESVSMKFAGYASYTAYPVYGTKPHEIWPKAARYLHFMGAGGAHVFVGPRGSQAHVNHPGNRANPFPKRVLDANRTEMLSDLHQRVHSALGGS